MILGINLQSLHSIVSFPLPSGLYEQRHEIFPTWPARVVRWEYGPLPNCQLGPKEIDWLLVPPGKASLLLTDHLITG